MKREPKKMKDVGKKAIEAEAVVAAGANPTGAMVAAGYMLLTAYLTDAFKSIETRRLPATSCSRTTGSRRATC